MTEIGENNLFHFLAGSPAFTRFRFWRICPEGSRHRFASASSEVTVTVEKHAEGKAEVDAVMKERHRAGVIDWWSEAGDVTCRLREGKLLGGGREVIHWTFRYGGPLS
ncbi:hypothetical protein A6A04_20550 [Paramagnetospirillum marisnigri]|uniref:Uncharacterized protein n=1 Tax=Paramagnetospirillum marisnigri TaxID=1285242 RepID=A0A178ME90_9PROT|nr:hypothetical protein [Paramagnetospirillum marisnigri]OAN46863.1 hypothetical protein A6A04_20550 [Paramagnetospirillum marisnigri]